MVSIIVVILILIVILDDNDDNNSPYSKNHSNNHTNANTTSPHLGFDQQRDWDASPSPPGRGIYCMSGETYV